MKYVYSFLVTLLIIACSSEEHNMKVHVEVDHLKKGTLYLQHVRDSLIMAIDSVEIDDKVTYTLGSTIQEPELFYLQLKKIDGDPNNDRIPFFGEKGDIFIHTSLKRFEIDAQISGSKTQDIYKEYVATIQKFNDEELMLIKPYFDALKNNNKDTITQLEKQSESLTKRKVLYTLNFAVNNSKSVVSPYIALMELQLENKSLLDTVYQRLSEDVKVSRYGKMLKENITESY